jgi:hypothetical protein
VTAAAESRRASLPNCAFAACAALQSVLCEEGSRLERIEPSAFLASGVREIALPPAVAHVPESCFLRCPKLASVRLADVFRSESPATSAFRGAGIGAFLVGPSI